MKHLDPLIRLNHRRAWTQMIKPVPKSMGVYSVWNGSVLLYIGRSVNMKSRLTTHNRMPDFMRYGADCVRFMICGDEQSANRTEAYLTVRHRPVLSCIYPDWRINWNNPILETLDTIQ